MRLPTWPIAAGALAGLLALVAGSVLTSSRKAQEIYAQLDELNRHQQQVETRLRRLRSDVHLSGIYVRDYLLDNERERAPEYRDHLSQLRRDNTETLRALRALSRPEDRSRLESLEAKLDDYWQAFDPLSDWTPIEKVLRSASFLRREVLPRRDAVLAIAQEIEEINNINLANQRAEVTARQAAFRADLQSLLWRSLLLGAVVAFTAVLRLRIMERRSDQQRTRAEEAEDQLRTLSQQLVATQEDERRRLSRELHDHLGQMLTGLRLEIGRLDRARSDSRFNDVIAECKTIVDTLLRTVRDLALGLRPSMLDDLGLQAALEWHVRDLRRRCAIRLELHVASDVTTLPDQYRTCVYRVVQEALTNCIRHSGASRVDVSVRRRDDSLEVSIADDGTGFDVRRRRAGLGLTGIEERARELGGRVELRSTAGHGTELRVILPPPRVSEGGADARLAS
jgi:signal transduction histidine kinase